MENQTAPSPQSTATAAQPTPPGFMRLEAVVEPMTSTRRVARKHVKALAESIAAVGLIQPMAVNPDGRLLAGGHRLAALRSLKDEQPDTFAKLFPDGLVPVRVMALANGELGARKAFEIEMTENEKRRDYTGKEISALVDRLKEAGYVASTAGPRKKGDNQKHLTEALATVLGKSRRQAQRLINASKPAIKPTVNEAATARCFRAMDQVLAAAAQEGTLTEAAQMLSDAVREKSRRLLQDGGETSKSGAQAA